MINFIKSLSPTVIVFFSMLSVCFFYMYLNQDLEKQIATLKVTYATEKQELAEAHRQELQKQTQLNSDLTYQLMARQNQITEQLQQIESVIDDAIKNDGANYNGIGADSLCLYKRAFGYSCQ